MRSLALVTSVKSDSREVSLQSVFSSACINCPKIEACENTGQSFTALNKKNLSLKKGDIVKIDMSSPVKVLFGISALFIPVIAALFMWYFSPLLLKIIKLPETENLRFFLCLAALLFMEGIMFILSRADIFPATPEIKQKL